MRELESLDQQALQENNNPPEYQHPEGDLMSLFREYEEGTPMYDEYIDVDSGGNYPKHASVRLSEEVLNHIEDSGEAVSQWIREACEARYRKEKDRRK